MPPIHSLMIVYHSFTELLEFRVLHSRSGEYLISIVKLYPQVKVSQSPQESQIKVSISKFAFGTRSADRYVSRFFGVAIIVSVHHSKHCFSPLSSKHFGVFRHQNAALCIYRVWKYTDRNTCNRLNIPGATCSRTLLLKKLKLSNCHIYKNIETKPRGVLFT